MDMKKGWRTRGKPVANPWQTRGKPVANFKKTFVPT